MNRRDLLFLFLLALVVRLLVAALIPRPGYMDAAYYAAGAVRLAQGGGLSQSFLWNYLDDPAGLPFPGFLYWMPLPSLLGGPFAALVPSSFFVLQLPFAVLSALLPLVGYVVSWQTTGRRRQAWTVGLLLLFSGLFFPYWTLPETFAPFALFGSLALLLAGWHRPGGKDWKQAAGRWLLVGLLVGLAHLTRPDGPLLLLTAILGAVLSGPREESPLGPVIGRLSAAILGYLLVMGPWFVRNLSVIGAPLSPAGSKTLWLRTYDDLFCYGCDLSLGTYLAWGWPRILESKLWAVGVNLERFLAEDCLILLLPFVLFGLYRLRHRLAHVLSFIYLVLIFLAHSLAFTFPGPRGGFFHASAAVLPFLFAAGAEGLETAVAWAGRRRHWNQRQAQTVFATAAVVAAVALSFYWTAGKLPPWRDADAVYSELGGWLARQGPGEATVMVANPPAFWYHTGRPAVVVPNGDVETLLATADRYEVRYVLLDPNRPAPLAELYAGDVVHPRLRRVTSWGEESQRTVLYAVER